MDGFEIATIILAIMVPIAAFLGFFITKKLIEKQLRDNPPITEEQIRSMFLQMGRKPSEKQIKSVMNSMRNPQAKKATAKKKK